MSAALQPPERVRKRAILMGLIALWGMDCSLSGACGATPEGWDDVASRFDLLDEMTHDERHLVDAFTQGTQTEEDVNAATFYCEALAELVFVMTLGDAPPVDSDVAPYPTIDAALNPVPELAALRLRSADECARERRVRFWVHRRLAAFLNGHRGCDLPAWIARTPGFEGGVEGLALVDGDLAFDGSALRDVAGLPYGRGFLDVAAWRLRVMNWVCSPALAFGEVFASAYDPAGGVPVKFALYPQAEVVSAGGADLDGRGGLALHHAAYLGRAIGDATAEALDRWDIDGDTALDCAVLGGHAETAAEIVARGAGRGLNGRGEVPLVCAIHRGDEAMVRALLAAGLPVDGGGVRPSPLHCAVPQGAGMVRALLDAGADREARDGAEHTALLFALETDARASVDALLDAGADVTVVDARKQSALHWASCRGNARHAELFVARGLDVDARSASGQTPLMLSALGGDAGLVRALAARSRDLDARGPQGATALHRAARGSAEAVAALLAAGADRGVRDDEGMTPFDRAVAYGCAEAAALLGG